jgi:hypothetical protein
LTPLPAAVAIPFNCASTRNIPSSETRPLHVGAFRLCVGLANLYIGRNLVCRRPSTPESLGFRISHLAMWRFAGVGRIRVIPAPAPLLTRQDQECDRRHHVAPSIASNGATNCRRIQKAARPFDREPEAASPVPFSSWPKATLVRGRRSSTRRSEANSHGRCKYAFRRGSDALSAQFIGHGARGGPNRLLADEDPEPCVAWWIHHGQTLPIQTV